MMAFLSRFSILPTPAQTWQRSDSWTRGIGIALIGIAFGWASNCALSEEFLCSDPIVVPDASEASPSPSTIHVDGFTGIVSSVKVKLFGVQHAHPDDLDIFLVSPDGKAVMLLSDAGGGVGLDGIDLTLDDTSVSTAEDELAISTGTYRPTDFEPGEPMPYENPIAGEDRLVSMALGGVNGDWRLFVSDDLSNGEGGSIASWSLEFEAGTILHADYRSESVIPLTTEQLTATGKSVDLHLTFAPSRGCDLTLVNQTGPNFIEGEFDNLPNGANVDLWYDGKVYHFVAWYFGGDGNDLKLLWRDAGLASWGRNVFGELGNGGSPIWYEVPVAVDQKGFLRGKTIAAVSAGSRHTLVLCTDGTLAAWGENQYGQIGDGTYLNRFTPVPVDQSGVLSGKEVFAISAGEYHNLVICSDGTLATWGANFSDQLGDPRHPFGGTTVPVEVNRDGTLSGRT
ncbi:MAG: hypothetical protein KDL87_15620, partial [Verrucomicrobiae bacterium]|nr:hypothetical protein [Verrucomicrobiae bacterium]